MLILPQSASNIINLLISQAGAFVRKRFIRLQIFLFLHNPLLKHLLTFGISKQNYLNVLKLVFFLLTSFVFIIGENS